MYVQIFDCRSFTKIAEPGVLAKLCITHGKVQSSVGQFLFSAFFASVGASPTPVLLHGTDSLPLHIHVFLHHIANTDLVIGPVPVLRDVVVL